MPESILSYALGAAASLALLGAEVGVIQLFKKTNTGSATVAVFGVFAIAFMTRMVLLLLASKIHPFEAYNGFDLGVAIVISYVFGLGLAAVLWTKKKG